MVPDLKSFLLKKTTFRNRRFWIKSKAIGLGKSQIFFENFLFQKHFNLARYDRYKEELRLVPDLKWFLLKKTNFKKCRFWIKSKAIGLGKLPISFENFLFKKHYNLARYDRYKEELSSVPDLKWFLLKKTTFKKCRFWIKSKAIGLGKLPISFENFLFKKHHNLARYDRYKEELSLVPDLKSFLLKKIHF